MGLAVGLCFGRRKRGTMEEAEGVCIFSQKWRLVVWVSNLAVNLCFGGKKTSMTINNIKILLIYIYIYIYIKQNDNQYRYTAKTTKYKTESTDSRIPPSLR